MLSAFITLANRVLYREHSGVTVLNLADGNGDESGSEDFDANEA